MNFEWNADNNKGKEPASFLMKPNNDLELINEDDEYSDKGDKNQQPKVDLRVSLDSKYGANLR